MLYGREGADQTACPPGLHESEYRRTDSVSLQSVAKRAKEFFEKLPEPSAEIMKNANEYRDQEQARRLAHRVQILQQS